MRYLHVNGNRSEIAGSIIGLEKRGVFVSAKQYTYIRDKHASEANQTNDENDTSGFMGFAIRNHGVTIPEGAELCILFEKTFTEMKGVKFGKNYRRQGKLIWCNSGGVLRIDTIKYDYYGCQGSSGPKEVIMGNYTARELNPEVIEIDEHRARIRAQIEAKRELAKGIQIEEGRVEVKGRVVSTKWVNNDFSPYGGTVLKILIERIDGVKFYGTSPRSLNPEQGDIVCFSANVKQKEPGFAIYTRPTKAYIVERGTKGKAEDADTEKFIARQTNLVTHGTYSEGM